jgi:hypothetical protein
VLWSRGLCDELITRPEESYRLCCVVVCDLETSRICTPYVYDISHLRVKKPCWMYLFMLQIIATKCTHYNVLIYRTPTCFGRYWPVNRSVVVQNECYPTPWWMMGQLEPKHVGCSVN